MGYLVGGMHLNGQVLARIDELDEQGELVAEALVVVFSYQFLFHLCHQLVQFSARTGTLAHQCFVVFHSADFPALPHPFLLEVEVLEGDDLIAAPEGGLQ